MSRYDDAATLFLSVRRGASPRLDGLPAPLRPESESDAYAIQQAVIAGLGGIAGWKVGSPNPAATRFTCAPLPAGTVSDGQMAVQGSDRGVEAEIAVRLRCDLPLRETPYTIDDIRAGSYTLWVNDEARARGVEITGGQVVELDWRCGAED